MTTLNATESPTLPPVDGPTWTETTRLMCAAAYLDSTFAQDVVEEIVEEPFRAVQVPAGVDLVPVVKHCLAAQRQKVVRDVVLMVLFVVFTVLGVKGLSVTPFVIGAFLGWVTVAVDRWLSTFAVANKRLGAAQFDPQDAPAIPDAAAAARVDDLARRQQGNLVVYSGFNPFSSAGIDLQGWSFVTDLRKGADRLGVRAEPAAIDTAAMYDAVTEKLLRLNIEGFTVQDRAFVNGTDIRDDRALLPDEMRRPLAQIGADQMAEHLRTPTHKIRHYRCFQIVDWRGELVITFFLRFAITDERLFAELSPFALLPVRQEYRVVDGVDQELTVGRVAGVILQSAAATFPLGLRSFGTAIRPLMRFQRQARRERQVRRDYFYDYGARRTALDRARSTSYARYFQKLDKEMHTKLLDRALLDAIVEFLDAHGIDTTELAQRRETIINNGIMVPGGSVNAHNVAVGQNASIITRLRGGGTRASRTEG